MRPSRLDDDLHVRAVDKCKPRPIGDWGLGIGNWELGIGNWELGIGIAIAKLST
ncbi:MAG: hypothetical protein AAFY50_21660 [Cyanobacteria bacterium J06648_1]